MGYRELSRMEMVEVVRRWQLGESQRAIARASGVARETVKKYLRAAEELGLAANGPPPTEDQVVRLVQVGRVVSAPRTWASPQADRLEPYREQITTWLQDEHLQVTRVQELLGHRGVHVPYSTLERFVGHLGLKPRGRRGDTVRMAPTPPGEVAEMDFERLGLLRNPETGRPQWIWGLSITLTYSRHSFLWPLVHQTVEATIEGLERAWAFFQGCPKRLVLDNFPAAVAGPDALNPRPTRAFVEYSQAHGFCWTRPAYGSPGTNPRSSDLSNTHAAASGRVARSSTSSTHATRPNGGAAKLLASAITARRTNYPWSFSRLKNARTCCRTTACPTTCRCGRT
jgi:transposase